MGATLASFNAGLFNHMPLMKGMSYFFPIALNELVLAIWLIAKGFNTTDTDLESLETGMEGQIPDEV